MTFYLIVKILISLFLIYSIRWLRRIFKDMELIAYYLMIASLIICMFNIVSINLELLKFKQSLVGVLIALIDRVIIVPISIVWLLYFYKKRNGVFLIKYIVTLIWFSFYVSLIYFNHFMKISEFHGWNGFIGYMEAVILYLAFMNFHLIVQFILKEVKF